MKQKNSNNNKLLPSLRIEPGTSDSKSDTVLAELTWHVLLRGSLNCLLFMHHFISWTEMINLESIEHDYTMILNSQTKKPMPG